jgi:hypothetical protein
MDCNDLGVAMSWMLTFLTMATLFWLASASTINGALAQTATVKEMQKDSHQSTTPPARDPKLAVEEEYQLALRQGTVQALELFIARHPDDPLVEKARASIRALPR